MGYPGKDKGAGVVIEVKMVKIVRMVRVIKVVRVVGLMMTTLTILTILTNLHCRCFNTLTISVFQPGKSPARICLRASPTSQR